MAKNQVFFETNNLFTKFQNSFLNSGATGIIDPLSPLFIVKTGTGTSTVQNVASVLQIAITANTASHVVEAKLASALDADTLKIAVKSNTQYTMKCKIRCTATAAPTGSTIRLVEVNAAGAQVGTVNSPTVLVTALQEFTETVLTFTTGALTAYLSPIFSVNGGATGTQTTQFRDFEIFETI